MRCFSSGDQLPQITQTQLLCCLHKFLLLFQCILQVLPIDTDFFAQLLSLGFQGIELFTQNLEVSTLKPSTPAILYPGAKFASRKGFLLDSVILQAQVVHSPVDLGHLQ